MTSIAAIGSASNPSMSAACARMMASMSAVDRLPTRNQTTLGGAPCKKLNCLKSASFETMAKAPAFANPQTLASSAAPSPALRTCSEPGKEVRKQADEARR